MIGRPAAWFSAAIVALLLAAFANLRAGQAPHAGAVFNTAADCMACHNSLTTPSGEDVSIGASWRSTMMANSSRDPYWQASVRRETIDHPSAAADIEDECSVCHMPMARTAARMEGRRGEIFAHLPVGKGSSASDRLAHDGVSCTICHQISSENLGTPASFTGGYLVKPGAAIGPFAIDKGLTTIMRSSAGREPAEGAHIRQSELCATCHTLITKALGKDGEVIGELPEQVMYLEWRHSAYPGEEKSCQSCHMPVVQEETRITSVLGKPRAGLARHVFVGGNSFILKMLNRYRRELAVEAPALELEASVARTVQNLQTATAELSIDDARVADGQVRFDVSVRNLTGHKLPTAYPSRRAWLHAVVRDRNGRIVFESGAISPAGSIAGNDNDADPTAFEPHYREITRADQVQIYESVMGDAGGKPTTGLLTGVRYLKDNRLLPRGFDKGSADPNVAVLGEAADDQDFSGGGDRVRYSVSVGGGDGPFRVDVELRFQSIGFRWAENLKAYDAPEPKQFTGYYQAMAANSSELLTRAVTTTR
jgi:hypothetical protein